MIRETQGTIYITADAFCDRYNLARRGQCFTYATGDLAAACKVDADARVLRALVMEMESNKRIALDLRQRPDLRTQTGAIAFEYCATKRVTTAQSRSQRTDERTSEAACA